MKKKKEEEEFHLIDLLSLTLLDMFPTKLMNELIHNIQLMSKVSAEFREDIDQIWFNIHQ